MACIGGLLAGTRMTTGTSRLGRLELGLALAPRCGICIRICSSTADPSSSSSSATARSLPAEPGIERAVMAAAAAADAASTGASLVRVTIITLPLPPAAPAEVEDDKPDSCCSFICWRKRRLSAATASRMRLGTALKSGSGAGAVGDDPSGWSPLEPAVPSAARTALRFEAPAATDLRVVAPTEREPLRLRPRLRSATVEAAVERLGAPPEEVRPSGKPRCGCCTEAESSPDAAATAAPTCCCRARRMKCGTTGSIGAAAAASAAARSTALRPRVPETPIEDDCIPSPVELRPWEFTGPELSIRPELASLPARVEAAAAPPPGLDSAGGARGRVGSTRVAADRGPERARNEGAGPASAEGKELVPPPRSCCDQCAGCVGSGASASGRAADARAAAASRVGEGRAGPVRNGTAWRA